MVPVRFYKTSIMKQAGIQKKRVKSLLRQHGACCLCSLNDFLGIINRFVCRSCTVVLLCTRVSANDDPEISEPAL